MVIGPRSQRSRSLESKTGPVERHLFLCLRVCVCAVAVINFRQDTTTTPLAVPTARPFVTRKGAAFLCRDQEQTLRTRGLC